MSQANVWITRSVYRLQLAGCERFIAGCACPFADIGSRRQKRNIQTLGEELATGAAQLGSAKPLFAPASEHCFCGSPLLLPELSVLSV